MSVPLCDPCALPTADGGLGEGERRAIPIMRVFSPRFPALVRNSRFAVVIAAAFLGVGRLVADGTGGPAIVLVPAGTARACFEIRGLRPDVLAALRTLPRDDPRWPQIFGVYVPAGATIDPPPMLGAYELSANAVRFKPRFPLERGIEYRAVFDWQTAPGTAANRVRLVAKFVVPVSRAGPPARVAAIYPSGGALPENLLRFYLQFSAPMSQGGCYRYVHLRDEAGTEIERPFLELPQELWSPDGTRLTLLFEPGRVKRGLVPRAEQGPILTAGRTYTLTVDAKWPDAEGRPLQKAVQKTFRAVQPDATQPDPRAWKIEPPPAGSREPLSVRFPEPLDQAMLHRVLHVLRLGTARGATADRTEVAGTIGIAEEETRWSFLPRDAWPSGRYVLAVSTTLEDRAGNSIGRPFEVDLNRSQPARPAPAVVEIEFEVRNKSPHHEGATAH